MKLFDSFCTNTKFDSFDHINTIVCINVYTIINFSMNDLNALNRMLTIKFELRIDWYTNTSQISNTANECNDVSLRSIAQQGSIDSIHELIFKNQLAAQWDRTVL